MLTLSPSRVTPWCFLCWHQNSELLLPLNSPTIKLFHLCRGCRVSLILLNTKRSREAFSIAHLHSHRRLEEASLLGASELRFQRHTKGKARKTTVKMSQTLTNRSYPSLMREWSSPLHMRRGVSKSNVANCILVSCYVISVFSNIPDQERLDNSSPKSLCVINKNFLCSLVRVYITIPV